MIRSWLGVLIAINAVLFLWIQYGDPSTKHVQHRQERKPDFGEIRLLQEVSAPTASPQQASDLPEP
ncbi:hypothetical protein, partial [Thiolapillus sp.]